MPRISTVQRSLLHLRKLGGDVAKVEQPYNRFSKRRNDLFGFCDILWIGRSGIHHYVQCCTFKDLTPHIHKIRHKAVARRLSKLPFVSIEVHAWRKIVKKGRARWELKVLFPFKEPANVLPEDNI